MILYSMIDSGNCYKPRLLMAKLGLAFTTIEVSSHTGDTRKADFVAKNPNAMVPLLELDDGRRLAESNAILLYLAEGTRFLPADRYERGLAYQWLFFEQYSHEPYIAVRKALLTFPERAGDATPERLAVTLERGNKALGVMNKYLENMPSSPAMRSASPTSRSMPTRIRRSRAASSSTPIRRSRPG